MTKLMLLSIEETAKKLSIEREEAIKQIMGEFSAEREGAIKQIMDEFSAERKQIFDDFLKEDQHVKALLSDIRLTLSEGNKLIGSADSLMTHLNLQPGEESSTSASEPFDIKDYQATLQEATNTVMQLNTLVNTIDKMGLEKTLPQITLAVQTIEEKGEKWVNLTFMLGLGLITIFLCGAIVASLIYRYLANRLFGSVTKQKHS